MDNDSVKKDEHLPVAYDHEEIQTHERKNENLELEHCVLNNRCLQSKEDSKSSLKCPNCGHEYKSKTEFLKHLQSYPGILKSCSECQKEFNNCFAFKFHELLEMCPKSNKVYKCKLCNKRLYGGSQYNAHMSAHNRNRCKICGEHFARLKHLEAHIVKAHNGTVSKELFRCHLCERKFTQRRSLVYHYKISHPGNDLICPVCLEIFDVSTEFESHQSLHKQQNFVCEKCSEVFSRKQQYLIHIKERCKQYKCQTCDMGFSAKKVALKHAKQFAGHIVSGLEPRLQCAHCGELFLSRAMLNTHMIEHTGGKTLFCEKCKVTFKRESNYRSHLESNEHLRGELLKNLLPCKECNKTFTNKNNLRVHINRMHKPNKELICTQCSYKTTMLNNMKRHMAMHTEKPRFICDKCGICVQTNASLKEHQQRLHNNCKEFSCDKCGKMFYRSSELNRHLKNKHSDMPLFTCHCDNSYKTLFSLRRHQLLSHDQVKEEQRCLKKSFSVENNCSPNMKAKRSKIKTESTSMTNDLKPARDDLQILTQITDVPPLMSDTNAVVVVANRNPQELLQVSYSTDFSEEKSQVIYAQSLDINNLQVVDSVIQLENNTEKQATNVVINVRNLFSCNEYVLPPSLEPSVVNDPDNSLCQETQNISVTSQKQDVISGLQDYTISNDINFLSV